jgi:hypothetical protein
MVKGVICAENIYIGMETTNGLARCKIMAHLFARG